VKLVLHPVLDKLGIKRKGKRIGLQAFRQCLASMLLRSRGALVAQRQLRHSDPSNPVLIWASSWRRQSRSAERCGISTPRYKQYRLVPRAFLASLSAGTNGLSRKRVRVEIAEKSHKSRGMTALHSVIVVIWSQFLCSAYWSLVLKVAEGGYGDVARSRPTERFRVDDVERSPLNWGLSEPYLMSLCVTQKERLFGIKEYNVIKVTPVGPERLIYPTEKPNT